MATGANPVLTVQQNIPQHVAELESEQGKLVSRLLEIQRELATCRALLLLTPERDPTPDSKEKP